MHKPHSTRSLQLAARRVLRGLLAVLMLTIVVQGALPVFAHIHHGHSWHVDCCETQRGDQDGEDRDEPTPHEDCEYDALEVVRARLAPVRDLVPDLPDVAVPATLASTDLLVALQRPTGAISARGPPGEEESPPLERGTGTSRVLRISHALIF